MTAQDDWALHRRRKIRADGIRFRADNAGTSGYILELTAIQLVHRIWEWRPEQIDDDGIKLISPDPLPLVQWPTAEPAMATPRAKSLDQSDSSITMPGDTIHKESEELRRESVETNHLDEDQVVEQPRSRLQHIHTHSSARSATSYTDGYVHVDDKSSHDQSLDRPEHAAANDPEKAFEVQFDGDDDPYSPRNKPTWRKWCIVLIGSSCSLCVTCASALYTSTYAQIEPEFGVSREVATLGLTTFVCGLGIGPMVLSPLSEFFGRRPIFLAAFGMYFVWLIPCAVAQNIQTMLIVRFFDGLAGSAFLSVAGGVVGDVFRRDQLSLPMMIYTASPFVGPEVGPVIGGFINQYTDWRWSFWVLVIWAGVLWTMILLFVPETYAPVLLRRKAIQLRKETGDDRWKAPIERMNRSVTRTVLWSCIRPFQLLFFEQMVLNLCLLSAILLGILYLFFGAFAIVFSDNHNFSESQVGLSFLGIFVGQVIGVSCDPFWRRNYDRLVRKNGGISEPEFRLPPTIIGALIVPVSLFGFGWTTYSRIHWIVPIIFSALFGMGNIFCFSGIFTFLVECYPLYAASALAANSFARSSFAAAFPLFGVQMYNNLGYQWASSVLAFIALAMCPFPYLFFRIGKKLRSRSSFAASSD